MPLQMIITAAKTVSRASPAFSAGAHHHRDDQRHLDDGDGDREHQVPNGSPVRCATTSAW